MKNCLAWVLILVGVCLVPSAGQGKAYGRPPRPVASSQKLHSLTGTYTRIKHRPDENQSATLQIKQTGRDDIRFDLTALWWSVGQMDSPHNGEIAATVALLRHRVAVYRSGDYTLTLRFRGHTVLVTESGSNPDFGASVSAAGTYRRRLRTGLD